MRPIGNTKAIMGKELYSYFASPVAYVFIIIFLMLSGFFTFNISQFFDANQASLRGFFHWHPWLYLFLVPAAGMRVWSEERRAGSLELLFTLSTTTTQAVVGKFIAGAIFLGLALVGTLPLVLTVTSLGSPDNGAVFCGYVGSFLTALVFLSISTLTSALTKNQVVAFIVSVVICLLVILCGWPPVTNMFSWAPTWIVDAVASFSIMPHYQGLQRGVISLDAVIYAFSLIAFCLFATDVVLKTRRA